MSDAPDDGAREPGEPDVSVGADASGEPGVSGDTDAPASARQRVERTGRRRARLTPAPDTDVSPEKPVRDEPAPGGTSDDERITRERPPHW